MTMAWSSWEDWNAGLYAQHKPDTAQVFESRALLCDPDEFIEVAREMVRAWPNSARQNLHHMWSGRRAWLGQASCCYSRGSSAGETRQAWGLMTDADQRTANAVAGIVIEEFHKEVIDGAETLFGY